MRESLVDFTATPAAGRSSVLTYEPYFGLKEKPFSLSSQPQFFFKSRTHAATFDELRAGIRRREGLIVLTGEPGTGKTTLCRSVVAALDRKTFCAIVPDPFVSREDLLKLLLIEFGVMSVEDLTSGRLNATSRSELSLPLYEFLKSLVPLQAYAVLIIDEAQNLPIPLLEEIRILADLEAPDKLIQLVLVGQPELRDKLKVPSMRQVDQRISVRCSLQPLDRDAVDAYLAHRLGVAGGTSDRVTFQPDAVDVLYMASKGNPRVINLIADKALHRAHLDRTWTMTADIVFAAISQLGLAKPTFDFEASFPAEKPAPVTASNVDAPPIEPPHLLLPSESHEPKSRHVNVVLIGAVVMAALLLAVLLAAGWRLSEREAAAARTANPPGPPIRRVGASVAPVVPPADVYAPVDSSNIAVR